jgi:hypothetical protein
VKKSSDATVRKETLAGPSGNTFTVRELIDELRRIRREFHWGLDEKRALYATLRSDEQCRLFDPVTAVAYFRTGEFLPRNHSREAGRRLGLSFQDCTRITAACHYDWHPRSPLGGLRRELLDAITDVEALTLTVH